LYRLVVAVAIITILVVLPCGAWLFLSTYDIWGRIPESR
jgi:hypothetical protein